MPPSRTAPLVFVLTPRLGDLNHRYLVSSTCPPDEHDVQEAFEGRRADDVLAVATDVSQKHGRTGEEWLIVRDPRIRSLSPARRSALLDLLRADLTDLAPPSASEAAASSGCVSFPPIDAIARRIHSELGLEKPVHSSPRQSFPMPIALAACAALLGAGFLLMAWRQDQGTPQRPRDAVVTPAVTVDQLVKDIAPEATGEADVVARIREKLAPDLRDKATLLEALNHLRPSIAKASNDDYQSPADAMKDKRMISAVKGTLAGTSLDAFLDEDARPRMLGLDPKGFRSLADELRAWPDTNAETERSVYREIERTIREASKAAQTRRSADERRIVGIFVYEDATELLPVVLGLFERGGSHELTAFGRSIVGDSQTPPDTLAGWLKTAEALHGSTGPTAHLWLSRDVLDMHKRQATAPQSKSPGAAKFYEQLDHLLRSCRGAIRTTAPQAQPQPQAPEAQPR